jgi:hypothetical protein
MDTAAVLDLFEKNTSLAPFISLVLRSVSLCGSIQE